MVAVKAVPPTVTAESPASGATGVSTLPTVSASFSQAVQAGTIQFALASSAGASVLATVVYNSSTNTATLTPIAPLADSMTYTATVSAAVSTNGLAMTTPFSWSFTTPAGATAISETPASSASNLYNAGVPVSSTVSVTFNEPVQAGTIALSLKDSSGNSVAGIVAYNSGTETATLTPNAALAYGMTYVATVSGALNSLLGSPWPFLSPGPS